MPANLDLTTGRPAIAIAEGSPLPWHGHGTEVPPGSGLDIWAEKGGLEYTVNEGPVLYYNPVKDGLDVAPNRKVLTRSDSGSVLSMVSSNYQVVQPADVLDFYRELIKDHGFEMETCGALDGGRRVWALAKVGLDARIMGQDQMLAYLLLATSYDGKMATIGRYTSVRVVCDNTLSFAVADAENSGQWQGQGWIRIPHFQAFDSAAVHGYLGTSEKAWNDFIEKSTELAKRKVSLKEAAEYFVNLVHGQDDEVDIGDIKENSTVGRLLTVYNGGKGQDLRSTKDTAFGLVNAVTRFQDHERNARDEGTRMNHAWFGQGQTMKQYAWNSAVDLIAA